MPKVVSAEWLAREIDKEMGHPRTPSRNFWTSVERRRRPPPKEGEPNWRYSFNAGAVPSGFEKRWEAIRGKFEEAYQLPQE